MIDLDAIRVTANRNRIPDSIWFMLCVVTIFSMVAVGYQFGLTGIAQLGRHDLAGAGLHHRSSC